MLVQRLPGGCLGMHDGHVVGLDEVLADELPVALEGAAVDLVEILHLAEVHAIELLHERRQEALEVRFVGGGVDEDPVVPLAAGHLGQTVRLVIEALDVMNPMAAEVGRVDQAAIEGVAPIMIGADQPTAPAAWFVDQLQAAMPAHIVEGAQPAVLATHQDDRATSHRNRHYIARRRQFVRETAQRPTAGENPVLLELEEPLTGIGFRRQAMLHRPGGLKIRQRLRFDDVLQQIAHVTASAPKKLLRSATEPFEMLNVPPSTVYEGGVLGQIL